MTIAFRGAVSIPADNGTLASGTHAITPLAGMVAGDLVVVHVGSRATAGTASFSVSETGGQTWNTLVANSPFALGAGATNISGQVFWCRFNGTWASNPFFGIAGSGGATIVMEVFIPTVGTNTWALDSGFVESAHSAPTTPFTVTRAGVATFAASTVAVAGFHSSDDNTWGSLTGAGWVVTGLAQYRNLSGQDFSASFAHRIQTVVDFTPNVTKNQATVGGDAGYTWLAVWKELPGGQAGNSTFALTGGGTLTGTVTHGGRRTVPLAGGGQVLSSTIHGTARSVALVGGGQLAGVGRKDAVAVLSVSGGGVFDIAVTPGSAPATNGTFAVAGGGQIATGLGVHGALRSAAVAGGGSGSATLLHGAVRLFAIGWHVNFSLTQLHGGLRAVGLSGGGQLAGIGEHGGVRTLALSGGGQVAMNTSAAAAALGAALLRRPHVRSHRGPMTSWRHY